MYAYVYVHRPMALAWYYYEYSCTALSTCCHMVASTVSTGVDLAIQYEEALGALGALGALLGALRL
jgi:hypothetical protein